MEQQADLLTRQAATLDEISAAIRTPAKTRAAERLADAAELLRRERREPALALASEATKDDPNNPGGFQAAAWAQLALGDMPAARELLVEAAMASDGADRSRNGRQAARTTLASDGASAALATLERFRVTERPAPPSEDLEDLSYVRSLDAWVGTTLEVAVTDLDRAVYLCQLDRGPEAADALRRSGEASGEFYAAALLDPFLGQDQELRTVAKTGLAETRTRAQALLEEVRNMFAGAASRSRELADCVDAVGNLANLSGPGTARTQLRCRWVRPMLRRRLRSATDVLGTDANSLRCSRCHGSSRT